MADNLKIDYSSLDEAIGSLRAGVAAPPRNDLERDGAIQRFEYTFELCWKFLRRCLVALGRRELGGSPKPLLREGFGEHLIDDLPAWFEFLEARNSTVHTYNKKEAERVYQIAEKFVPFAERLLIEMKKRVV